MKKSLVSVARVLVICAGTLALSVVASAETQRSEKKPVAHHMATAKSEHVTLTPSELKWENAPPVFPAGAMVAQLEGDPSKPGPFTIRIKAPDGYKVMPHWHPTSEHLTIISGEFHLGMGDTFDDTKGKELPAGSYASMPAHMHHFAWLKGETIVQIHGMGPFKIIYINPADDPSGMQGKSSSTKTSKR